MSEHGMMSFGVPIYVSPFLGPRPHMKRCYLRKKWMTDAHHSRVTKKWRKRYGEEMRDDILRTADAIYVSKENLEKIKAATRSDSESQKGECP